MWLDSNTHPPTLTHPTCQDCGSDPFIKIPEEIYSLPGVTVCRHETNIRWSIKEGTVLVQAKYMNEPEKYWYVVDYYHCGTSPKEYTRVWRGSHSLDVKDTKWMPIPKISFKRER